MEYFSWLFSLNFTRFPVGFLRKHSRTWWINLIHAFWTYISFFVSFSVWSSSWVLGQHPDQGPSCSVGLERHPILERVLMGPTFFHFTSLCVNVLLGKLKALVIILHLHPDLCFIIIRGWERFQSLTPLTCLLFLREFLKLHFMVFDFTCCENYSCCSRGMKCCYFVRRQWDHRHADRVACCIVSQDSWKPSDNSLFLNIYKVCIMMLVVWWWSNPASTARFISDLAPLGIVLTGLGIRFRKGNSPRINPACWKVVLTQSI